MAIFEKYHQAIQASETIGKIGHIDRIEGLIIRVRGLKSAIGEQCYIIGGRFDARVPAEVVSASGDWLTIMPYKETHGIKVGQPVISYGEYLQVPVSRKLLGRVLDSRGNPVDGASPIVPEEYYPILSSPPPFFERQMIRKQIVTGIRAIDAFIPVGKGQRLGIFSGSGVGKSTLMGMLARNTRANVSVIALIGERGREAQEFIYNVLGQDGLESSVLVVSTSDSTPLARLRGAFVATAIAEYFRDLGNDVLLLFDSVTRFARAQREIGLASGEPPTIRGFPPSVYTILPMLLERCCPSDKGTITGFYTVLVEGDDLDEPISDAIRGILDGHIVLSRHLAERSHYPAIDILKSSSRLEANIVSNEMKDLSKRIRKLVAIYRDSEDLINIGAYAQGSDPEIDQSIALRPSINNFLMQSNVDVGYLEDVRAEIAKILEK